MKRNVLFFILIVFLFQPGMVLAMDNAQLKNFDSEFKRQSKDQYPYKKVNKKYDTYLINLVNNNDKTVIICADTELDFLLDDNAKVTSETRREIYRKTRSKDIGKYYWIGMPCSAIAGGIIGLTFGLGTPVAIGVMILGTMPSTKAAKINADFAKDLYTARKLPLRFEPHQLYQVRIFTQKGKKVNKLILTDLSFENDFSKKYDLELNLNIDGGSL